MIGDIKNVVDRTLDKMKEMQKELTKTNKTMDQKIIYGIKLDNKGAWKGKVEVLFTASDQQELRSAFKKKLTYFKER